ncbi:unnamed protein product [Rotaria socialis]|uniref:Kinesin light chain n=2 Tax=Rotaria socialis TaxID=392032 RepID=A0A817TLH7_9BILA|nr:unnamed protein product [Rotaria socialis]
MANILSSCSATEAVTGNECVLASKENKEIITLVWFDPNIGSRDDTKLAMKRLREINDYVLFYTDVESCIVYINAVEKEKIFLVTSGSRSSEILPRIHTLEQVDSIFIFCKKKNRYQHLIDEYRKLVDIYVSIESLCESIREQAELVYKQIQTFSFFNQHQSSTRELIKQSSEFIWFQLFTYIILRLPRNEQAKKQMLDICRHYYRDNERQWKLIDDFERTYCSQEAIHWYTKQSFVYKLVNKALRTEDIDQLYAFRFFICDLSRNLAQQHKILVESGITELNLYRGAQLSIEELNRLKINQGKPISTNGYLSTSRLREKALEFAKKPTSRTNAIPVLFQVQCNVQQLRDSIILADVANFSPYINEQEVLFDLNATFRIEMIEHTGEIWLVNMVASEDGKAITEDYIEIARRDSEEKTVSIMFGRLMCDMGEYDKSRKYFENLLASSAENDDRASIEFNIGRAYYNKGEWIIAREYYDRAYDRMMGVDPPQTKESASVLNSIGIDLQRQQQFDEARDYYERALTIRQKYYPEDHPDIAQSLHSIGNVLDDQDKYIEALKFYRQALQIRERHYPACHPYIACSLNNIALVLKKQAKYDNALQFYQRALVIYERYYPTDHPDIATALNNIASIYIIERKYNSAFEFCQRALKIYEQFYSSDHPDIVANRNTIESLTRILKNRH